ncbi:MAG: glutaminyl-peptide cyclotransferase [Planctomycetaceae bacterium]|nr:glutaminyl-peptide cyclotransferase [Planctomycetaceae bacterium]
MPTATDQPKKAAESKTPAASRRWRRLVPGAILILSVVSAVVVLLVPKESAATAPVQRVKVVNVFPHDRGSFCQGLVVHNDAILEGTGHYNQSRLRLVDLESGKPSIDLQLPAEIFGEGVTVWKNRILQLTWKNGYMIQYDADTFERTGTVSLNAIDRTLYEGWGITHDGTDLIISDGSSTLRFVDPESFQLKRQVRVRDGIRALTRLNELEYVNGEILANVWYRDSIARINPKTGRVAGWLDLAPLRPAEIRNDKEAALNGIAWNAKQKRLFVTGKNWPVLYEISF